MNAAQNRELHALLSELGMMAQKADIIYGATRGRVDHSRDLTTEEADKIISNLREQKDQRAIAMRKKIIHRMALMGYTNADNVPDYDRINGFIVHRTGDRNPHKKKLNYLNLKELHGVLQQIEAIYKALLKNISHATDGHNSQAKGDSPHNAGKRSGGNEASAQTSEQPASKTPAP